VTLTLTFDLCVSACQTTVIEYMCTEFGVDSSSRFLERGQMTDTQTDEQTDKQTDATESPTHTGGYTAGVGNNF